MNQSELLSALEESREKLMDAIEGLSQEAMQEPGVTNQVGKEHRWSVKDILAHLSRWEAELARALWQAKHGQSPAPTDPAKVDEINAQWHAEMCSRPLRKVLDDFEAVRAQTLLRVETFTERELTDPRRYPWMGGEPLWKWIASDSFEHEAEHLADIVAWRARRGI